MLRGTRLLVVAAAFAAALPAAALEQKSTGKADRDFLAEAASANLKEIELGRIAAGRAASPRVKEFAQHMVDDHSKAYDELKQVAMRGSVTLPAKMNEKDRLAAERLAKLHGADFDRAYMAAMVQDHRMVVEKFRKQAESAADPDLKDFAAKTLPTLEHHLQMAQDVASDTSRATSGASRQHGK